MRNQSVLILFCYLLMTKNVTVRGQGLIPTNIGLNLPNMNFDDLATFAAIVGVSGLVLTGNEVYAGANYTDPKLIWDKTKDANVKGGFGFNIEFRKTITKKDKIILGVQRNNYVKLLVSNFEEKRHYNYYYIGYIRELHSEKSTNWKPYWGAELMCSNSSLSVGVLGGLRLYLNDAMQLESRMTLSPKNTNLQLGISVRYRKGK